MEVSFGGLCMEDRFSREWMGQRQLGLNDDEAASFERHGKNVIESSALTASEIPHARPRGATGRRK